jgi:hypothetical protein
LGKVEGLFDEHVDGRRLEAIAVEVEHGHVLVTNPLGANLGVGDCSAVTGTRGW